MSRLNQAQTSKLVNEIVASYRKDESTVPMESVSPPSREVIIKMIFMLRELLFPEYFGQRQLISSTIEYHIGDLLINLHRILHEQIVLALTHQAINKNMTSHQIDEKADEIIYQFLSKIPALRSSIELDIQAAFDGDPAATSKEEIIFSYPGVFGVSVYRMAHELQLLSVPLIPRIMTEYAHSVTGIDIHPGATIGSYFFIDHGPVWLSVKRPPSAIM
jgi:serine O-acetyltransferase